MNWKGYALTRAYQSTKSTSAVEGIDQTLETMVREGARQMLAAALEHEVDAFLGRERYERGKDFRGYRNGHLPSRELTVGVSAVEVRVPRVAQVPEDLAPAGFHSQVVQRYERASASTQALFARLYLEGLATGDFEPVFRELVGETTALSPTTIVRLKERWADEYATWKQRPLAAHQYAREVGPALRRRGPRGWHEGTARPGAGVPGEHRELAGPAAGSSGSRDERALVGGWRWWARPLGGARRGLPSDRTPALLESSGAQRPGQAAQAAPAGGASPTPRHVDRGHPGGV